MTENEQQLLEIVRTSADPEKVACYMISLFLNYLQTHDPSQETHSAALPESA